MCQREGVRDARGGGETQARRRRVDSVLARVSLVRDMSLTCLNINDVFKANVSTRHDIKIYFFEAHVAENVSTS